MANRVRAWLRRRIRSKGRRPPGETKFRGPNTKPVPNFQDDSPPPLYNTLDLLRHGAGQPTTTETDGSETVESLRALFPATPLRHENSTILTAPPHSTTPSEAATEAAYSAYVGVCRALDETDSRMVAARTAQAIAVAVSTSRSYAAFIAAVNAAESAGYLSLGADRDQISYDQARTRAGCAVRTAANTAMAADAGITPIGPWPFNIYDAHSAESSSQTTHEYQT